jgi:hypothetical protein
MSKTRENHPFLEMLVFVLIALSIWLVKVTWPVWPFLVASLAGHAMAQMRREESVLADACREVLLPVTAGLGILCGLMALLNTSALVISTRHLHDSEYALIRAHFWIAERLKMLDAPRTVAVLLFALTWAIPRINFVSSFLTLKTAAQRISIVLMTVTTFTLFSQEPLENLVRGKQIENAKQYKLLVREEEGVVAQYLAARDITRALPSLDKLTCSNLDALFTRIESKAPNDAILKQLSKRARVTAYLAKEDVETNMRRLAHNTMFLGYFSTTVEPDSPIPETLATPPSSRAEYDQEDLVLAQRAQRKNSATQLQRAALLGLKEVFANVLGLATPEIKGIGGIYIEQVMDTLSERVFDREAQEWVRADLPYEQLASPKQPETADEPRFDPNQLVANAQKISDPADRARVNDIIEQRVSDAIVKVPPPLPVRDPDDHPDKDEKNHK